MHTNTHIYTHAHTLIYTHIHMCTYVHTHTYKYHLQSVCVLEPLFPRLRAAAWCWVNTTRLRQRFWGFSQLCLKQIYFPSLDFICKGKKLRSDWTMFVTSSRFQIWHKWEIITLMPYMVGLPSGSNGILCVAGISLKSNKRVIKKFWSLIMVPKAECEENNFRWIHLCFWRAYLFFGCGCPCWASWW